MAAVLIMSKIIQDIKKIQEVAFPYTVMCHLTGRIVLSDNFIHCISQTERTIITNDVIL